MWERVRVALLGAVAVHHLGEAELAGRLGCRGPLDARRDERLDRQGVQPGECSDVLVDDRVAAGRRHPVEVGAAGNQIHHHRPGSVDPTAHGQDRDAVVGEDLLEAHLVLEGEGQHRVGPVAADAQLRRLAVTVDLGEPRRSPPRLAGNRPHRTADVRLDPCDDRGGDVRAVICGRSAHRVSPRAGHLILTHLSDLGPFPLRRPARLSEHCLQHPPACQRGFSCCQKIAS